MDEQLDTDARPTPQPTSARGRLGQPRFRLGAVVALAIAAGLIAWAVVGGKSSSTNPGGPGTVAKAIDPVGLSESGLKTLAKAVGQPIYWAGPQAGYMYELRRTTIGQVFVRYLPPGAKAGAPGSNYLIVGTYPFPNALASLQSTAKGNEIKLPDGGIAVVDQSYSKSVHLAFPGVDYQIEVYDPSPAHALQVASSGNVQPVA